MFRKRKAGVDEKINDCWRTPREVFDHYNDEFKFIADVAASDENHLCDRYLTRVDNALNLNWGLRWPGTKLSLEGDCSWVWCNMPFSKIEDWLKKIIAEVSRGLGVVALVPYNAQKYWAKLVIPHASRIDLIIGRVAFGHSETGLPANNCSFATAIIVFKPRRQLLDKAVVRFLDSQLREIY